MHQLSSNSEQTQKPKVWIYYSTSIRRICQSRLGNQTPENTTPLQLLPSHGGTFGLTIQCSMMCTDMVRHATQAQNSIENKITVTPFVLKWQVTSE